MDLARIAKLVLVLQIALASCYLKVDNIDVAANEKYNKVRVTLDNSDPEKTTIDYLSELTSDKPLQRAKMMISVKVSAASSKNESLFRCGNEIIKTNIDICKIGTIQSTTFAKVLMENFAKTSNFDVKCPLPAKNYTLNAFSITDSFLLRFPNEQKLCLELVLSVSTSMKGKLDVMWQLKAWIRFKKTSKN